MINLPTLKTLSLPDFSAYDAQRRLFLQQTFGEAYFNQTDVERWDQLTARFMPFLVSDDDREQFNIFCERRRVASENQHVAGLGQLRGYFESYLFLLTNTHPDYTLSGDKREALKTKILEPIRNPVCEMGTITHFEEALFEHERADDWISYELHVYRQNAIRLLAESYNQLYDIGIGMSIHVIAHMKRRALVRGIGLSFQDEVEDAYLSRAETTRINRYFDDRIDDCVHHYHQEMVSNLAHFVLQEMVQALGGHLQARAFADWEQAPLSLSDAALQALTALIAKYFPKHTPMALMQEDEYNILQNRGQVRQRLSQYVEEALLEKGYLLGLDAIRANPALQERLWCLPRVSLDTLLNCPEDQVLLLEKTILEAYPSLFKRAIAPYRRGQLIPYPLRISPLFLSNLVGGLGRLLQDEAGACDAALLDLAVKPLLAVSQIDTMYLKELPESLWDNERFARALVGFDKRFLTLFGAAIRFRLASEQSELRWDATTSYESQLLEISTISPSVHQLLQTMGLENQFDAIQRLNHIIQLLNRPHLSPFQWMECAKGLTPSLLNEILRYRKTRAYPRPSFPIDLTALSEFEGVLREQWGNRTYLEARAQLVEWLATNDVGLMAQKRAEMLDAFLVTENWLQALLVYQSKNINSFGAHSELRRYVSQTLKALLNVSWGLTKTGLLVIAKGLAASVVVVELLAHLVLFGVIITLVASVFALRLGFGEHFAKALARNIGEMGIVRTSMAYLARWGGGSRFGLMDSLLNFFTAPLGWQEAVVEPWGDLKHALNALLSYIGQWLGDTPLSKEVAFIFTIEQALLAGVSCNTERHPNDEALYVVWQQMLKDAGEFEDLSVFRRLIHVPYAVSFDGNVRQVSFWQLANATSAEASVASARKASMFSFFRAHPESKLVKLLKEHGLVEPVLETEAEEAVALAIG